MGSLATEIGHFFTNLVLRVNHCCGIWNSVLASRWQHQPWAWACSAVM